MNIEFAHPLSGNRLLELFDKYSSILFPKLVSQSPELATERAENYFGVELTQAATDIPALAEIRDCIYKNSTDDRYINSYAIILPHTHWKKREPIIYSFDKINARYIIGPHKVINTQKYYPVSFVFHKGSALPYEWADETVDIAPEEYETCYQIIQEVAKNYIEDYFPFGIGIDFRFKTSLFSTFGGTVEIPEEDPNSPNAEFSYIFSQHDFDQVNMNLSLTQVAWHPRSDKLLKLTDEETKLLNELRFLLGRAKNQEERYQIIAAIEKVIP